jgi:hypothetical protein
METLGDGNSWRWKLLAMETLGDGNFLAMGMIELAKCAPTNFKAGGVAAKLAVRRSGLNARPLFRDATRGFCPAARMCVSARELAIKHFYRSHRLVSGRAEPAPCHYQPQ